MLFDSNQSSSGNPSACYDAKNACIRLLGECSLLEGSIIEMDQADQSDTSFLMGEVMEIVIMGDGQVPLAVHNERVKKMAQSPTTILSIAAPRVNKTAQSPTSIAAPEALAAGGEGGSLRQNYVNAQPKKYVYDELRRAEIQSLMKDQSIGREEKLRRMAEIKAKYEDLHSQASTSKESEKHPPEAIATPDPQPQQSSARAVDRWNQGAVAAVSANVLNQSIASKPDEQPTVDNNSARVRASNSWNNAAAAAVSSNTLNQSITQPKPDEQPTADNNSVRQRASIRWNKAAVTAVSANTLNQSITQPKSDEQPTADNNSVRQRASIRWNKAAVTAVSANTLRQSMTIKQSSEQPKNTNKEDIDDLIRLLRFNDPSLSSLILDGRGFDEASWEGLFDSIEENTHVTELSLVNCNLEDSSLATLILALVENETLISIDLSYNEDLTDETGDALRKVLRQGNAIVKKINIEGTSISLETSDKIQTILDERDDAVMLAKLQEARQAKIKALLAFSASGEVEKNRRISSDDEDDEDAHALPKRRLNSSVSSTMSQRSGSSSKSSSSKSIGSEATTGEEVKIILELAANEAMFLETAAQAQQL
eukprot:CAMPEP_0201711078 /NCGR_PEP_ID=MMETSP0578-20130828/58960_1 /ASSEMBLY_ACC=CAM_ASM_000663 /TAXON_ID=267565 /ORGANISM="Skeletonema grethea, Strain CCMP 1804" /LENGTH=595 /DNA_ID=CAMNT_0048200127 /DNA_START=22 /DNA_END=1810 /DNA_ORIENTATION=-